jgi:7-dehydrocholesterol reductase
MLGWALLVIVFAVAGAQRNGGVSPGAVVNAALINVYLLKFFYWETGYFNTLDITLDRAGYYLCWGCLCWVQVLNMLMLIVCDTQISIGVAKVFYTYSAYYLVAQPSPSPLAECAAIAIFGTVSLLLNYAADRQKEVFKANSGKCHIWGRPAKSMVRQSCLGRFT